MIELRSCSAEDLPAILAIFNYEIENGTAIYEYEPYTAAYLETWYQHKLKNNRPVLIAEINEQVCGFGTFDSYRTKKGYRFTVEHSIYVAHDFHRRGIGSALLEALIERATEDGFHIMIAGIDATNHGSIKFHEKLGFETVAHFKEVGYKFDRWLDDVFMQKTLSDPAQ